MRSTLVSVVVVGVIASAACAAVEPLALPVVWQVKLDPQDVGVKQNWYAPKIDDTKWKPLGTHDWEGWEKQGMAEGVDFAWYRVEHAIPETIQSKEYVYMYFSCVDEEAWVWLNGQRVGEHTLVSEEWVGVDSKMRNRMWITPFSFNIKPFLHSKGSNEFAVRIRRGGPAGGGIWKPVYLFASDEPLELEQMTGRAEGLNIQALEAKEPTIQYDVWTTNPYDPVYPNTKSSGPVKITQQGLGESRAHSLVKSIGVVGACGEYVPVALHVRNHSDKMLPIRFDLAGVRHEPTKLLLRADRVLVHTIDYVLTRLKKLVPDPLPRADGSNALRVGPGETSSYFLLIDTRGMPAGLWKGRVALTPLRNGPKLEIPFELQVAPVVLPDRVPIWVSFWSFPPAYSWMTEGRGPNKPYMDLMRRTGTNVVQMSYRDGGPKPILDKNNDIVGIKVDEFDRMMARRQFTHHDYLVVGLTIRRGTNRWGPHFLDDEHDQWKRNFVAYMKMLARHIRDNYGLAHDRWGLYMNDEHIGSDFVPLGKLVRQGDPDIQIWANRIEDLETTKKAEPYIDVIVPYSPWLSPKGLGHGKNAEAETFFLGTGKPWWAYRHAIARTPEMTAYPRGNPNSPHGMLRSRPWLAWKLKLQGYCFHPYTLRWFQRYSGFPDSTPNRHSYTNVGFIYMGHNGPVTSRRLEAYRDGWEDYKLLWIVKQAAQIEGQDSQLAQQALAHIESSVDKVLAGASADDLEQIRQTLIDDAVRLGSSAPPLTAVITDIDTTSRSATVRLSSSQPIRVWTWLNRDGNHRRFIDATRATNTPVVMIDNLVPAEQCKLTLVIGGPHGQQAVLQHELATKGW